MEKREVNVYISLLELGPSAIRKIAERSGINRGTTHDLLHKLLKIGLVSYYHKETKQHFIAEDPKNISKILSRRKNEIEEAETELEKIMPVLNSISEAQTGKPIVKFYENFEGIRSILEEILDSAEKLTKKEYAVYSSSAIRPYLYDKRAFPNFTKERIKREIFVRTIADGIGGSVSGKDERKCITKKESTPTYILICAEKVAMISVGKNKIPHGLIIEDKEIFNTQLFIFNSLWKYIN